jgi:hypothetical protein
MGSAGQRRALLDMIRLIQGPPQQVALSLASLKICDIVRSRHVGVEAIATNKSICAVRQSRMVKVAINFYV